jgi:enoyl-CoA hydratase
MPEFETIIYEESDYIGTITLNRPEVKNALSVKMKDELSEVLSSRALDPNVRVVIITGGLECFSAGADLKGLPESGLLDKVMTRRDHPVHAIENFSKPIIAAVAGPAYGGGLEMALACDIRIAATNARFALSEIKLGVLPQAGGTQRLPRIVGLSYAKEMLYTGDPVDAEKALRIGLVSKVVEKERLMEEARSLAEKLASRAPLALQMAKKVIDVGIKMDLDSALDYELAAAAVLKETEDREEGIAAFREKRKPRFKGK